MCIVHADSFVPDLTFFCSRFCVLENRCNQCKIVKAIHGPDGMRVRGDHNHLPDPNLIIKHSFKKALKDTIRQTANSVKNNGKQMSIT